MAWSAWRTHKKGALLGHARWMPPQQSMIIAMRLLALWKPKAREVTTRILRLRPGDSSGKPLGGNKRVQIAPGESAEVEPKSVSFVPGDLVPPAWRGDKVNHKPKIRNWWPAALGTAGAILAAGWSWSKTKGSHID